MAAVKTILVLIAACGLLLASQRPAQAQVSWGIPLPFPFMFYNFNQGYYSQPYNGQRVITTGVTTAGPVTAHLRGARTFTAPIIAQDFITDQPGSRATTTARAGAATEVGSRKSSGLAIQS